MKKILFAVIGIVCLMTSCSKDDFTENQINPNSGKEVNFGMTIDAVTRTLYGSESEDGTKNPIYWVHGDNITIYGVDCAVGRNQADYAVSTEGVDAEGKTVINTTQNYATALNKTGDYGVQWGDKTSSDFFAVYPKVEAGAFKNNNDGSVTVRTKVNKTQNVRFEYNEAQNTWVGTHYSGTLAEGNSMTDAVMYAITPNAQSTASQVDLRFTPYSTVLRFTFNGFSVAKADGSNEIDYTSEVSINRIVLSAPNKCISGEFDMTLDNKMKVSSDISDTSKASGEIIILPNQLPLKSKQKLQFDVFTIPQKDAVMPGEDGIWTVTFETNKGTVVYNLQPLKNGEPTNAPLQIAQIHKITIPERRIVTDFEIPAEKWIRYIPRNIYLTELSVPGAWYAYDQESTSNNYQNTTNLNDLFSAGIRAFHLDCRLTYNSGNSGEMDLYCAGTEPSELGSISGTGIKVLSQLETLANQLSTEENKDEFIYVILTIAENAKKDSGATLGSVAPNDVLNKIYGILNANADKLNLYTTPINANTTLNDVLGKIVVVINANAAPETFTKFSWWNDYTTKALITENSMSSSSNSDSGITKGYFKGMNTRDAYWGNSITDPLINVYSHIAQRTYSTDFYSTNSNANKESSEFLEKPTLSDRQDAIDDICAQAKTIYNNNKHNGLFIIGIGGYVYDRTYGRELLDWSNHWHDTGSENRTTLSNSLNPHMLTKVNERAMSSETASPLGIILMNFATTTKTENGVTTVIGSDLTKAIIDMNTKFKLNRDTNKEAWPDGNPFENIGGDDNTGGGTTDPDQPEV